MAAGQTREASLRDEAEAALEREITTILAAASLDEKVTMMSGQGFFAQFVASGKRWGAEPYRAGGGIERLAIAPFYFTDGPRGVARGNSTCFPCTMARGATFDVALERRVGEAMGIEIRAQGCNLSGAVCVNLLRHPAWGRAQETYGEDQHHLGAMGSALCGGIQTHNVAATVKHLALNSMENARFKVDVRVDERALHEVYLPHFKTIVDAGVATVMSAYNKVNGAYCGHNATLLTDILRGEWGFDGFVHSDWVKGVYDVSGVVAGLDVENPEPIVWGPKLLAAVEAGDVSQDAIDAACRRIMRVTLRLRDAVDPQTYTSDMVACSAHVALAREVAEKSAVLLKNDGLLPLDTNRYRRVAVLGRLAPLANTGDFGSSRVQPPHVVTALAGVEQWIAEHGDDSCRVTHADEGDITACVAAAELADVAVIVVGYTADEEGEYIPGDIALGADGPASAETAPRRARGGDRASLDLPTEQIAMIDAVAATGRPFVVVIVAGAAVLVEQWHQRPGAIIQSFYAGMEGGSALARILFGSVNPSGRLPFTVARDAAHYPHFDRDADSIDYGYWHGYAKLAHEGQSPRYAFGYGLSYARFAYADLRVVCSAETLTISVDVRNTAGPAGEHAVLCFIGCPGTIQPRPEASLQAFARVMLHPEETRRVTMTVPIANLRYRDIVRHDWAMESGEYRIMIMRDAADGNPLSVRVAL